MRTATTTPARRATDLPATPALLATYSDVLWADQNAQAAWADYRAGRGTWQTARYWQAVHRALLRGYLRLTLMEAGQGVGALDQVAPRPAHAIAVTDRGAVCRDCDWRWSVGPGADGHSFIIAHTPPVDVSEADHV